VSGSNITIRLFVNIYILVVNKYSLMSYRIYTIFALVKTKKKYVAVKQVREFIDE
jgi:hypothetical protein